MKTKLYLNGAWADGDGGTFPVMNPADESTLAEVASASVDQALAAVDASANAMKGWAARTPRERSDVLRCAYDLFVERLDSFIELITLKNGKGYADAKGEVLYSAEFFRWYAEESVRVPGHLGHAPASGARTLVHAKPAGVALLITPWNYPAAMGTRKIGPALAAGCGMLVKPASETPLTMLALAQLLEDAGVPPGLVNVLPTRQTGAVVEAVLADPRVRVVSFTGSTEVGQNLLAVAARHVVNPAMELGGNTPFIVFDDADLDAAVEGLMVAKLRNLGEACTAANRIYVQRGVYAAFAGKLVEKMSGLRMGNGLDRTNDIGPLVNAATRDKVHHFVTDAISRGATLRLGGELPEGKGHFYPPTVLTDVPTDADCVGDEIFGPVAALQPFETEDEVILKANDTKYGLVAYVFAGEMGRGLRVSEQLDYGMVGLNRGLVSDPAAPFGGTKQSGIGREGGADGLEEFMEKQYISTVW